MRRKKKADAGITAEEHLRRSTQELVMRNRIAEVFLTVPDEEMYTKVLAIILEALESAYGVFGFLDEDGHLVVPTMTRTVWDVCQIPDKRIVFRRETWTDSSWPRAIREQRTICLNESSTRIPAGHIPIARHISMPLVHRGEVRGPIQVANKETDYTPDDVALLETIGGAIAPVLDARLGWERQEAVRNKTEEALRASNERPRTILRSIGDAVITTDSQGRVELVNAMAEALTGWQEQEARGKLLKDVFRIVNEETQSSMRPIARTIGASSPASMSCWR